LSSQPAVIVVGGGASGLSAAGALARRGIASLVLEQDAAVGGTWARRYDRLHLHTMRQFSGLAHFPIPNRYPRYLSRSQFVEYLNDYVRQLGLSVVTGASVSRIRLRDGAWQIETSTESVPSPGRAPAYASRVVVIATGQYREPIIPGWPGREQYRGHLAHSSTYRNATPFAGRRVLVVGAGNSGAEIATDLAEGGASFVALSVRTPPPIVPRDPFGLPIQRTSLLLSALPPAIADRIGGTTARLALGDLTRHGMPAADFTPYRRRHVPLIDVGFADALRRRTVVIRRAVESLSPDGVTFADGTSEPFDAIVAATGFTTGLGSLVDPALLNHDCEPTGRAGDPTSAAGLYFVGFTHSLRGHLFEANRDSRRLARNVERYLDS
jgi:cation diffusion facilitator CzcD-associated flavoprotein CzcO